MEQMLPMLATLAIFAGCGDRQPVPAGRLYQPAGDFSIVTPEGWHRRKLAGIDFMVVAGEPDRGVTPNLFTDFATGTGTISDAMSAVLQQYQVNQCSYEVVRTLPFETGSGLEGLKVTARRTAQDALPLATYHYIVRVGDRIVAITATCAAATEQAYEPVFDEAVRTLEPGQGGKP